MSLEVYAVCLLAGHYVSSTPQSVEDNEVPGPSTDEDEDTWNVKVSRQDVRNILNARGMQFPSCERS